METDPEEILSNLHQLVKNVEPIIKESESADAAEDAILHLEETDENFHKYDFVRQIRSQLESSMGHLIDEEIETSSMGSSMNATTGQETLVQLVTKSVSESKGFSAIVRKLCGETLAASETIIQSIEDERLSAIGEEDSNSQQSRRHQSVFSDGGSTYDQGLYFLSQEQFHRIAEEMDPQKSLTDRREALKRLCQVPPSDVMASESWTQLRVSLMAALADSDVDIAHDALSFHARMFAVSNHQIMRETYTCLAEHLETLFNSPKHDRLPLIVDGIDITQPEVIHVLKRIRLLNEFQKQVPSIWVRYPENFLEAIVESTLSIIVLHPTSGMKDVISPLHLFSLVDTKANWLKKWLHGNYSRYIVIKQMQQDFRVFLQDAVEHCVTFCEKCRIRQSNINHITKKMKQHKISEDKRRTKYSPAELEHLTFIHSLCVLGRLLLYSQGRELFPIRTKSGKEISIQTLVITWMKVLNLAKHKPKSDQKNFEPALLTGKVLRTLCSSSAFVESCINTDIIDALLAPVKSWLNEGVPNQDVNKRASEATMLLISEILACLTSTSPGQKKLMYGCSEDKHTKSRKFSAAAHVVAEFAQKALRGTLPPISGLTQHSYLVTGSFVFVCRQIYNTCEGLALLKNYRLHECIAKAWKQIHDKQGEVSTPTGSDDDEAVHGISCDTSPSQSMSHNMLLWEENLIDNLLNYAATPKGLLLLQQTGAINECVSYMYSRYRKKLQVSKCEKFGYGVMVTQIAATAPGIVALQLAGFEKALVHELWAGLECATDEIRMTAPPPHPISQIDRSVHKFFIGLVNILSSYDAVFHVFQHQLPNKPSYSFREMPDSVLQVLDRLVMINSEAKVHSLFNYEQSHVFGLRLVSVLCCCLDTWLLLETQYNIQQALLLMQKDNCTYEGNIIIDALSVERNHILVRTQAIGGPSERRLPPRSLQMYPPSHKLSKHHIYPWPLFNKFPLPKEYTPSMGTKSLVKKESVVSRFLSKTKSSDKNRGWLEQCRDMFTKTMMSSPGVLKGSVLAELLEKAVIAQERMPEERVFSNPLIKDHPVKDNLNSISNVGIKMVARYGKHLNLLKSNTEATTTNLSYVLRHCQSLLEEQQENVPHDMMNDLQMKTLQGPYHGFDWFASTVFLLMGGNKEKTWAFLQKISDLLCSGFIWPARLHASMHLPREMRLSGIRPLFSHTGHHVELILQNELPLVHSTFRMCGYTPSQICQHWLKQCFWNYMDWNQINHYLAVVIIMGTDYQVYICISILKHLEKEILEHRLTQNLQVFLKENPVSNFTVSYYMDYMKTLESKYRATVLPDLRSIAGKGGHSHH